MLSLWVKSNEISTPNSLLIQERTFNEEDNNVSSNTNEISTPNLPLFQERTFNEEVDHDNSFRASTPLLINKTNSQFNNIDISNIPNINTYENFNIASNNDADTLNGVR